MSKAPPTANPSFPRPQGAHGERCPQLDAADLCPRPATCPDMFPLLVVGGSLSLLHGGDFRGSSPSDLGTGSHQGRVLSYCVLGLHLWGPQYFFLNNGPATSALWSWQIWLRVDVHGRPFLTLDGRGCRRWVMACLGPGIASPHTPRSLCDPSLTQGSGGGEPQQRGHMAEVTAPH